jgi:hypothetical protein
MILLGATLVLYFKGSLIQRLSPDLQNKKIRLILENCRLHIDPPSDSGVRDRFVLDYRSGISSILENFLSSMNPFTYEDKGTEFVYRIIHYDDIRGCNLNFSPPTLLTMTELAIECIGECTITQPEGRDSSHHIQYHRNKHFSKPRESQCWKFSGQIDQGLFPSQ